MTQRGIALISGSSTVTSKIMESGLVVFGQDAPIDMHISGAIGITLSNSLADDNNFIRVNAFGTASLENISASYIINIPSSNVSSSFVQLAIDELGAKIAAVTGGLGEPRLTVSASNGVGDIKISTGQLRLLNSSSNLNISLNDGGDDVSVTYALSNDPIFNTITASIANITDIANIATASIASALVPVLDAVITNGTANNRWLDMFAVQTTVGAVFEFGLTTHGIEKYDTGTVLVWEDGCARPCYKKEDYNVVGVSKYGKQQPIILGAEHVLVTGNVAAGDWIVTSKKPGHGCAAKRKNFLGFKRDLFGKVIGQALEDCEGDSILIKCLVQKM